MVDFCFCSAMENASNRTPTARLDEFCARQFVDFLTFGGMNVTRFLRPRGGSVLAALDCSS